MVYTPSAKLRLRAQLLAPEVYSPDPNPIEQVFSKIEGLLRRAEESTREALFEVVGAALSAFDAQDASGFFGRYGYHTMVQLL